MTDLSVVVDSNFSAAPLMLRGLTLSTNVQFPHQISSCLSQFFLSAVCILFFCISSRCQTFGLFTTKRANSCWLVWRNNLWELHYNCLLKSIVKSVLRLPSTPNKAAKHFQRLKWPFIFREQKLWDSVFCTHVHVCLNCAKFQPFPPII